MKLRPKITVLLLIFLGACILRLVSLSDFPSALGRDEAYLGYNAYSILVTGRDINSNQLPLFIESFLFTPAGYAYLSIPFIKIFGLTVFSVRMASAIFGAVTIPLLYFTIEILLKKQKTKLGGINSIALIASFLLAITPWHINLSRTASVSTVVLFFILLGLYCFLQYIEKKKLLYLFFAFFFFLFTLLFYIAPYSFIPLFIVILYLLFRKQIKHTKVFFCLSVLLLIPIAFVLLSPDLALRTRTLSITKAPIVGLMITEDTSTDGVNNLSVLEARAFHNKISVIGSIFIRNYFSHLSYDFLFDDKGFPDRYRVPQAPLLFPIYILFLLAGFYFLAKRDGRLGVFLVLWIAISPLGSSFASDDVPNLQRTLFMLPPILFVIAIGVSGVFEMSKKYLRIALFGISAVILLYQILFYSHQYIIHENMYRPWYRQDGYEELVSKIQKYQNKFKRVVVTNRESAPTIFLLFFEKYNPLLAQKAIAQSTLKDTDRISFANYEISQEECPLRLVKDEKSGETSIVGEKDVLYVNSGFCKSETIPSSAHILDTIKRKDGTPVFFLLSLQN